MRDLPLNALRAFASVYLTGGIRPAGRALGVTHSSIARHLTELEALVGAPLIERDRSTRTLTFTPLGERLGKDASNVLTTLDRSWAAARERRSTNTVTISTAPSFASLWLLPRLPKLAAEHPRIEVSVLAEQRVRHPQDEGSDVSIRMGKPRRGERAVPLMDDALTPVASPKFLGDPVTESFTTGNPAALDSHLQKKPLLHDRDPNAQWSLWADQFGMKSLDFSSGPRFSSSDLLLRAAKQGLGVALARLRFAADDIAAGSLVRLSNETVPLPEAYWIIRARNERARPAVEKVCDWLRREGQSPVTL